MSYHDDSPTLSEFDGIRYLHFGTKWVQGAMQINRPAKLVLDYTQQMMAWLLFMDPQPDDQVGILGLGAGSLLRYTLKRTPVHVETVEWNPQVTAMCRAYFRLPDSDLSVITHADAGDWVHEPCNRNRFSALMVDLYDAQAEGPVRGSSEFYEGCHQVLNDAGILVVNLFGNHNSFPYNIQNIQHAFGARVLQLPQTVAGNRIVLAFGDSALQQTTADLLDRAHHVSDRYKLPAVKWARALLDQRVSVPGARQAESGCDTGAGISLEA